MAKISEKHIREAKIAQLRNKIAEEYKVEVVKYRKDIQDDAYWEEAMLCLHALYCLNTWIHKHDFMIALDVNEAHDYIVYPISDKIIDMLLDEDIHISDYYLAAVAHNHDLKYSIGCLTDSFFAHQFFSCVDHCIYDNKLKKQQESSVFNEQQMIAVCNDMGIELAENDGSIVFPEIGPDFFQVQTNTRQTTTRTEQEDFYEDTK